MTASPTMLAIALRHAARGLPVVALHHPRFDAGGAVRCSCPAGAGCATIGKHPLLAGWPAQATTEAEQLRRIYGRHPRANIGIRAGRAPSRAWQDSQKRWHFEYTDTGSGILALDVDPRHGGDETRADLEAEHGPLPHTVRALTGGGGQHILLTFDGPSIRNNQDGDTLGPGLDIRADGGQFVAPGSIHPSGEQYRWEASCHPNDVAIAAAPAWLLALLRADTPRPLPAGDRFDTAAALAGVPEGQRDRTLFKLASKLRAADVPRDWAETLVMDAAANCVPPFPEHDALAKVASAYGAYQPSSARAEMLSAAFKGEVPAESILLPFRTAREVAVSTPDRVEWAACPWLVFGSITELDAKIKLGKTTLVLALCGAMLDGRPFMGQPTSRTPVVYLTEQPPRSFREALRRADLLDREDFVVLFHHDTRGTPWPAQVAAAVAKAEAISARALLVDTLPQFAGLKGDEENNAGAALEAVEPLQDAAAIHGLAVLIVRHERKSGGDVGDSGRGSSAFGGAVDIVLSLRKGEGNTRPTIRVIHALSRYDETPDTLAIELDKETGEYEALGAATAVAVPDAMTAITAAAPTTAAEAATVRQLLARVKTVTRTVAQEAIARLEEGGVLLKTGDGKKGSPFRYWRHRVEIHSAGTPPLSRGRMNSSTIGADSGLFENGDRPEEHEMLSAATPVVAAE